MEREELISSYVDICNCAIDEVQDTFWYRQGRKLNERIWDGAKFRGVVYDEDPREKIDEFTLEFDAQNQRLSLLPQGEHEVSLTWKVPLSYLRDVVEVRPDWYLAHPTMLDWNWLGRRLGDQAKQMVKEPSPLVVCAVGFGLGLALGSISSRYFGKTGRRVEVRA